MPVPDHQVCGDQQHALSEWQLDLSTAHEYVTAEESSDGTAPTTLSFDAALHVGYVLSDASALSLAQEVQEVESLWSLFKLDDDDIMPPQTRSTTHTSFPISSIF